MAHIWIQNPRSLNSECDTTNYADEQYLC